MRACRSVEREERSTCLHPITTQTPTPNSHIPDNGPDCPLDLPGSQKWAASRARDGGEDSLDREDTEQIKVIATSDVIVMNTSPSSLTTSPQLLASPCDSGGQASCRPKRYRGWCPATKKCSSHASSCYLPLTLSYVHESHLHYSSITSRQLVGYDSSLMGSFNVMPSYKSYFTLTTTTKSLNTAVSYVGGAAISFISGPWTDWRGRREAIFWSAVITLVGGVIQGASQNIAMFIAGRLIVGFGMGLAQTSTPTLLAETVPVQYRGFAMGLYYACWGVGTLLASGVCYGTQTLSTTWSWRIPSLLQAAPSVWCFVILLFIPESPRWLIAKGRKEEALQILAIANGSGENTEDTVVQLWAKEIEDTIQFERNREASAWKSVLHPSNRKRMLIVATFPLFVMLPGTNIVTFYFGDMLSSAGIEDANTQLQINVILTSFTLVVALAGSWFADKTGRKKLCAGSLTGGVISLYILAGLTAKYGTSGQKGGIYGTIAMIFIYNATYAWGITPLTVLYPPEVLSFDIRALGMGIYTLVTKLCGLFVAMVIPFGMEAISWKVYIINASVDILFVIFVVLVWVETRGLTLEEVDKVFDGVKHSDVPDLETVKAGKYGDVEVTESASKAHRRETVI